MKNWKRNQWVFGGLLFLLIGLLPLSAFCQKASIKEVNVKAVHGGWQISFYVEDCFTEKMEEAIHTGIQTTFTFYLNLYQKRKIWKDRKVASVEFRHTLQYNPIRGEYHVKLEENHSSPSIVTSKIGEAKELMATVKDVEIRPSSTLKPGIRTQVHIKAELDRVRLPFLLEYLLFFVSLWDFETDWHVETLQP